MLVCTLELCFVECCTGDRLRGVAQWPREGWEALASPHAAERRRICDWGLRSPEDSTGVLQ